MSMSPCDIAKKLVHIQSRLRNNLLKELQCHEDDLDNSFDPYAYSPLVHEIKEKYLSRLYVIQALIQELAHLNQGRRNRTVRVLSVRAGDSEALVELVNEKLAGLNGAKIMDVKFLQSKDADDWVAVISFVANPFSGAKDETAAWM